MCQEGSYGGQRRRRSCRSCCTSFCACSTCAGWRQRRRGDFCTLLRDLYALHFATSSRRSLHLLHRLVALREFAPRSPRLATHDEPATEARTIRLRSKSLSSTRSLLLVSRSSKPSRERARRQRYSASVKRRRRSDPFASSTALPTSPSSPTPSASSSTSVRSARRPTRSPMLISHRGPPSLRKPSSSSLQISSLGCSVPRMGTTPFRNLDSGSGSAPKPSVRCSSFAPKGRTDAPELAALRIIRALERYADSTSVEVLIEQMVRQRKESPQVPDHLLLQWTKQLWKRVKDLSDTSVPLPSFAHVKMCLLDPTFKLDYDLILYDEAQVRSVLCGLPRRESSAAFARTRGSRRRPAPSFL